MGEGAGGKGRGSLYCVRLYGGRVATEKIVACTKVYLSQFWEVLAWSELKPQGLENNM